MLVAPAGAAAERLGVILIPFGAVDTVAAFAARPVAAHVAVLPIGAFALACQLLLTFVSILTLLAVRTFAKVVTRATWPTWRLSRIRGSRRRCCTIGRYGRFGGWR